MTLVAAALIAGSSTVLVALIALWPVKRRLDDCERDRRQTKQLLQLFIGALVGVVPEPSRLKLLEAAAEMSTHTDAA